MTESLDDFDWSVTTWEGSRREQLRRWSKLSFREKMEGLEETCDVGFRLLDSRIRKGLPYFDPYTGQLVRPSPPARTP